MHALVYIKNVQHATLKLMPTALPRTKQTAGSGTPYDLRTRVACFNDQVGLQR